MTTSSLLLTLAALTTSGAIDWSPTYKDALERAASESRVIFVAVHLPGERANERMAEEVYTDKRIQALAERTVNLIALSMDQYEKQGARIDLGDLDEDQLRRQGIEIQSNILKPDAQGFVVAPQHVFLDPEGRVLLSVPYAVTAAELEWCFVRALALVDPEHAPQASKHAKPPKHLLMGEVIEGTQESLGPAPATLKEVRELIAMLRKSKRVEGKRAARLRILTADEEEARGYISQELRGGGRKGDEVRANTIRHIARRSPASWWEVVVEFRTHQNPTVREAVIACLEQLAAPGSLSDIKSAMGKEKDARLQGAWLRAYASAGAADSKVRKTVLKAAVNTKDALGRANAVLALGYLTAGEDVDEILLEIVVDEDAPTGLRTAAICAAALTRRGEVWREPLEAVARAENAPVKEVAAAALLVFDRGSLKPLGPFVQSACGDEVVREAMYGGR